MSHLRLVPPLAPQECLCDRPSGRYWHQGAWNCTATDAMVRFYPTLGWHHYTGTNPEWSSRPSTDKNGYIITEQEQAA